MCIDVPPPPGDAHRSSGRPSVREVRQLRRRALLLLVVLVVNVAVEVVWISITLLVAGALLLLTTQHKRVPWRLGVAAAWIAAAGISHWWWPQAGAASSGLLRLGVAVVWANWFAASISGASLRRLVRSISLPEWLVDLLDEMWRNGWVLVCELRRKRDAAWASGRLADRLQIPRTYTQLLARAGGDALEHSLRLEDARAVRSAAVTPALSSAVGAPDCSAIEVDELQVTFPNGRIGLDCERLRIESGEWVVIVGATGSGKSTLLRALAGLEECRGSLRRFGAELVGKPRHERFDPRVGLVFQNPDDQFFSATAIEDLSWGLRMRGVEPAEARRMAAEAVDAVGLGERAYDPLHHLSLGQKKLVALAGAFACRPELLLLDEPTSGLDPRAARRIIKSAGVLSDAGATVLWTTHELDRLPDQAHRAIVLNEGKPVYDGPIADKNFEAALSAAHLVDPATTSNDSPFEHLQENV